MPPFIGIPFNSFAELRAVAAPMASYRMLPFGVRALDDRLAGSGLRAGALHEVAARSCSLVDNAAATLFLAGIAAREAAGTGGPVLWASCRNDLYAPGLAQAGLLSADVIHAQPRDDQELLAVIEDAVRDGTPSAIVAEAARVPMVATRRLQLVAADEPIGTAEAIARVMKDLLDDLALVLQTRGLGARSLRLVGSRIDGTEQIVGIGTSLPTREVPHLLRLLKLRIERIEPGEGIEQFVLVAPHTEPLDAVDLGAVLAGDTLVRDSSRLVDVVAGRIGERAVFRIAPVPSHVPERAVTRINPIDVPGEWPAWPRPVRLFARPEPLRGVIALLPDQPPRRFEWRGRSHRVVAGDGPERIHGEWWRRDAEVWAVRDYFRVEDEAGGRFWLFRRGDGVEDETGDLSWWIHGVFA